MGQLSSNRYQEGQVWEYAARPEDEGSLLKIQKIEPCFAIASDDFVYHLSIIGVRLKKPGLEPVIAHAPVSRETLDSSVTCLSSSKADFPSAEEGIAIWRRDAGGVFEIPVRSAVDYIDDVSQSSAVTD